MNSHMIKVTLTMIISCNEEQKNRAVSDEGARRATETVVGACKAASDNLLNLHGIEVEHVEMEINEHVH